MDFLEEAKKAMAMAHRLTSGYKDMLYREATAYAAIAQAEAIVEQTAHSSAASYAAIAQALAIVEQTAEIKRIADAALWGTKNEE